MALQTDRLVMIGLGVTGDAQRRPLAEQPPLPDGIHLRWAFSREAAFPWHGYYLFRRPHERQGSICLSENLAELDPGPLSPATWPVAGKGTFHSDAPLARRDDLGRPGLDLAGRGYLAFSLLPDEPAYCLEATIAFPQAAAGEEQCLTFPADSLERLGRQFTIEGVEFELELRRVSSLPPSFAIRLTATLPQPSGRLSVEMSAPDGAVVLLEALDDADQVVAARRVDVQDQPADYELVASRPVSRYRLRSSRGVVRPHRLCYWPAAKGGRGVTVTALDGAEPVAAESLAFAPGQTVTTRLCFDRITGVHFSPGDGVLVELCLYPVTLGITKNWSPPPGLRQPITLPLTHPDYPARPGPANLPDDWALAEQRITYGLPDPWRGDAFAALHDQLAALVAGGPPGSPMLAMDSPARATRAIAGVELTPTGQQPPTLTELHPLDLVVLGAMHPALAQMTGLYWADASAQPGAGYDYLLVADLTGVGRRKATGMLDHVENNGFVGVDAWVTFDQRLTPAPPLSPPAGVRAYGLPGSTYRAADGSLGEAPGNAGLTWPLARGEGGYLRPGHPVMYHVWRDRQGNGATPIAKSEALELVTHDGPLLLTQPAGIADQPVGFPADWPPFPLRYLDFALAEGWYGYQVNAIDLFGRYSAKSDFAGWWQWSPPPAPKPWYYVDPPAERAVHPASLRILDKVAPPPPLAVEAYALDPADPLLIRDKAYEEWQATFPAAGRDHLVGLRVAWWWTAAQQRQAPHVAEFRLYWHDGAALPANREDVAAWQLRAFVCPYGQQVTVLAQDEVITVEQNGQATQVVNHRAGDRRYEVFLPIAGVTGPFSAGVPLTPGLTNPVAYAHVTVTAADAAAHSADRWPGGGPLAGRAGNEGRPAAPQRVYCVWRQPPDPPPPLPQPARHYATPADYHNRSYFTYHWSPAAHLSVHVCRALDDSVFKADWAGRGARGTIDPANPQHRSYFPPEWSEPRCQATAAALNGIASPAGYGSLSDDALLVLAGLPGNERAFSQLTTAPLTSATSSLTDTLDGRATNCYFYRALYVDPAQNRSTLSLASAPVYLPNVTPPKAPVITKIVGGDRAITLTWASNRERDLAEYRVYRAASREAAGDLRLMTLVHTMTVAPGDPAARPASVSWTDEPLPGLTDFWYGVVAVDRVDAVDVRGGGGNVSGLSGVVRVRASCLTPPPLYSWVSGAWDSISGKPGIRLAWANSEPNTQAILQRRRAGTTIWTAAADRLQPDSTGHHFDHVDFSTDPNISYEYQLIAVDCGGNRSGESDILVVAASQS